MIETGGGVMLELGAELNWRLGAELLRPARICLILLFSVLFHKCSLT